MNEQDIAYELRALQTLFTTGQLDTVQRLTAIETQMKTLLGNGQPGRITLIENTVNGLQNFRYTVVGYALAAGTVASLSLTAVLHFMGRIK